MKPDIDLPFPDHTRVRLTIELVEPETTSAAAWERLLRLMDEKPLVGFAGKLSRDERSERD